MKLVRSMVLILSVLIPASSTLAHADDMKEGDKAGETKKEGKKKKGKKEKKGDMGDMKDMKDMK
jgi:hypothetical protein